MMISFDFSFLESPVLLALMGAALFATLWLLVVYCTRIYRMPRYAARRREQNPLGASSARQGVSVIVYCKDSSEALAAMLPELLMQQYDAPFEVIVTTDGRSSFAEDVVTRLSADFRNLRMTYVPDEAHALSRRKLAMTLGVKAARYEIVMLTDANVEVPSPRWLDTIARNFADSRVEVVIGHSNLADRQGRGERLSSAFNSLADAVTYLSSAVARNPYRGTDRNLAFRRKKFFDNNGFAQSVGLHQGIDDIFVSQIANGDNTVVELAAEATPKRLCDNVKERHTTDKLNHLFTGRMTSHASRIIFGLSSLMMWVWLGVAVAVGVLGFPNLLPLSIAVGLGLAWIITGSLIWRSAAKALHTRINAWLTPFFMFGRPLSNLAYRLRSRTSKASNYTWNKDRY